MIAKDFHQEISGSLTPELEGSPRSRIHESRTAVQHTPSAAASEPARLDGSQLQKKTGAETGC